MANFNQVTLAGNITRDVELKHTGAGTAVCEIGLAVNDRRKGQDGNYIEETMFIDVTLWGRQAEVADQYCRKGSNVLVTGKLKMDEWDDRNTGAKRQKIKVTAIQMQMLGDRGSVVSSSPKSGQAGTGAQSAGGVTVDGEIPF